jgi:hypothetical protein
MSDLINAVQLLDKVPGVLGIRYNEGKTTCTVRVLRDSLELRRRVAEILARYGARHTIEVVVGLPGHRDEVERCVAEAREASARRGTSKGLPPSYVNRPRKG